MEMRQDLERDRRESAATDDDDGDDDGPERGSAVGEDGLGEALAVQTEAGVARSTTATVESNFWVWICEPHLGVVGGTT